MYTRTYWLHEFENAARIGIMARPEGGEWLEQEMAQLKEQGIGLVVSLLEKNEIMELALVQEERYCRQHQITFVSFPIPDRQVPREDQLVDILIQEIIIRLGAGRSVIIHARMGAGRAAIIAGAVLVRTGVKAAIVLEHIRKERGWKVPDTDEQEKWLLKFAS